MSGPNLVSLGMLVGGLATVGIGLFALVTRAKRAQSAPDDGDISDDDADTGAPGPRQYATATSLGAALIIVATLILGIEGIERRGMSHVEAYVPGIDLPAEISEPPPRHELGHTLWWHWHREPHPQGYYILMWGWTKVFGTSLPALRLPSVLFAAGSVLLVFLIGRREFGEGSGLLASGLLAFNGHHVFWSQHARMYAMSAFLATLSLWFLLCLLRTERRSLRLEAGYLLTTVLGVFTQMYFWLFLAVQMLYCLVLQIKDGVDRRRLFSLQVLSVILGSPLWAHAVYRARRVPIDLTSLGFVQDFVNFGFLFRPDQWSRPPRDISLVPEAGLTVIALLAIGAFLLAVSRRSEFSPSERSDGLSSRHLFVVAGGVAVVILALARESYRRQMLIALTALVPLTAAAASHLFERLTPKRTDSSRSGPWPPWLSPILWMGLGTALLAFLVGRIEPFLTSRGLLVAVPPLLLVLGAGLRALLRKTPAFGVIVLLLVGTGCYSSIVYYRDVPRPNGYRDLATQMKGHFEKGDVVLVRKRDWVTTPIYYHLRGHHHRLIADRYDQRLDRSGAGRVWVLQFSGRERPDDMMTAVDGYQPTVHLTALRAEATLYRKASGKTW